MKVLKRLRVNKMKIILDGRVCTDRTETHLYLKEMLDFPEYYGMNLDALYDCASTLKDVEVHLFYWHLMVEQLGHYGQLVIETLSEAAQENPHFEFVLEEETEDDVVI